jgi:hypothetical protein
MLMEGVSDLGTPEARTRPHASGALIVEQHQQASETVGALHEAEVIAAESGKVRRRQCREAGDRHQYVALTGIPLEIDELIHLVALRDAAVGMKRLLEDARQHHRGMQVQSPLISSSRIGFPP